MGGSLGRLENTIVKISSAASFLCNVHCSLCIHSEAAGVIYVAGFDALMCYMHHNNLQVVFD